jgi:hypothetical protein
VCVKRKPSIGLEAEHGNYMMLDNGTEHSKAFTGRLIMVTHRTTKQQKYGHIGPRDTCNRQFASPSPFPKEKNLLSLSGHDVLH